MRQLRDHGWIPNGLSSFSPRSGRTSPELGLMFIPIPIKAKYFVPGIIAVDLFLGFKGSSLFGSGGTGIAHFAHIGGALTGFLMMWYWKKNSFNKNRWDL